MSYQKWRDMLVSALDPRFYDGDWLDAEVARDGVSILFDDNGCVIVEVFTYPSGWRELKFIASAGCAERLVADIFPMVEKFARDNGCTSMRIQSRDAWAKLMEPKGFYRYQQILEKAL